MKRSIFIALFSFMLIGCTNDEIMQDKDEYLVFKEELLEQTEFTNDEEINFDINISVDRINEEEISYSAIIDNPKENMYDVQAIIIHDYLIDDIFPSIGIFDEKIDLLIGNEEDKDINLVGYIQTTKDINELNLNIRLYIEYTNEENEIVKIYYKTTK